jgi:hypothetical protein
MAAAIDEEIRRALAVANETDRLRLREIESLKDQLGQASACLILGIPECAESDASTVEAAVTAYQSLCKENRELKKAVFELSRAARPLSTFAFNVGQHRPDEERTLADVSRFDLANNLALQLAKKE